MEKNADLKFNISATANQSITSNIRFSTQDEGSAKLTFFLFKDGVELPLNAVVGKLVMRMRDSSKFTDNVSIIDKVNGIAEYKLTAEQLKHYGKVTAELYLYYEEQKLSVHRFTFTILQALIDEDIPVLTEFYIDDFEELKATINSMADETTEIINTVGINVEEAKGKADEAITLIEQNQVVKLTEFNENKQQVTAQLATTDEQINKVKERTYTRIFKPKFDRSISMGNVSNTTGGSSVATTEWISSQLNKFKYLGVDGLYIILHCGINTSTNTLFLAGGSDVYNKIQYTVTLADQLGLEIRAIKLHCEEPGRQLRLETIQSSMGIAAFQTAYTNLLTSLLNNFSTTTDKFIILNERYYFYTDTNYNNFCISLLNLIKNKGMKASISSGFGDFLNMTPTIKDALDFVSINDYYELSAKGIDTTVDDAITAFSLQNSVTTYIPYMIPKNKEFYITETGCMDIEEALYVGWQWSFSDMTTHNGKIQEIFLRGFFEVFKDLNIAGAGYWWDIDSNNASIIKEYLGKE